MKVKIFNSMRPEEISYDINRFLSEIECDYEVKEFIYKIDKPFNCVMIIYMLKKA